MALTRRGQPLTSPELDTLRGAVGGPGFTGAINQATTLEMFTGNGWRMNHERYLVVAGQEHCITVWVYVSDDYWTSAPRFASAGFYLGTAGVGGQEINLGNDYSVNGRRFRVGFDGPLQTLTFSGEQSGVVPDGGALWNDADDSIVIPPRSMCFVITEETFPLGGYRPGVAQGVRNRFGDRVEFSASSLLAKLDAPETISATLPTDGRVYFPAPVAGVAKGWDGRPAVLGIGDSIMEATGWVRNTCASFGERGHFDLGMTAQDGGALRLPAVNWGKGGAVADGIDATAGFKKRSALLKQLPNVPMTSILNGLGTNDKGADTDNWRSKIADCNLEIKAQFPAQRLVHHTLAHRTISTDGFVTVANQAQREEWAFYPSSKADVVNNWLMAGSTVADVVIDWRENLDGRRVGGTIGKFRGDIKGSFSATLQANSAVGAVTISLNALPELGTVLAIDTGGTVETRTVFAHGPIPSGGPYLVQLAGSAGTLASSHTSGALVAEAISEDGTHFPPDLCYFLAPDFWAPQKVKGVFI